MQYVHFEGHQSSFRTIRCGVPQGSMLGSLLFLVYINDLPLLAGHCNFILFADDSNVFFSDKCAASLEKKVNCKLEMISVWFKANKLSLKSYRKAAPLHTLKIVIDNQELLQDSSTNLLDVHVDQHLTWNDHILHISKKLSKNISILSQIRHSMLISIHSSVYTTHCFSHIYLIVTYAEVQITPRD